MSFSLQKAGIAVVCAGAAYALYKAVQASVVKAEPEGDAKQTATPDNAVSSSAPADLDPVAKALIDVRARVAAASKEFGKQTPVLVAVSKTKPASDVAACYEQGQRHFGENYVQEIVAKAPALPGDIRWHFIGHLQSNKINNILTIPNLYMIETVDSAKLARALDKRCKALGRTLKVLVQVNTSGEVQKSGVAPEDCVKLARVVAEECGVLELAGVMTIGRFDESPKDDCYECLIKCRDAVEAALNLTDLIVSMGMSGDFEHAIKWGATSVRIGSTIFGARKVKR